LRDVIVTNPLEEDLIRRADTYVQSRKLSLDRQYPLGAGIDGAVWRTNRPSALKVCERDQSFRDEVECYRRLKDAKISYLQDFAVPQLIDSDERLMALEISIVSPPFLLDFGKVYLDAPPPYWNDREVMGHWQAEGEQNFGERWNEVMSLIGMLQKYGIWYIDPKPGNVMFGD
jgi:hypothetical protein